MRLTEITEMLATVKHRRSDAEAKAKRLKAREGELLKELAAEKSAMTAALKEADNANA